MFPNDCLQAYLYKRLFLSGVARGAKWGRVPSGGTRPGAQALRAQQHFFAVILNVFLSRNLTKECLKMCIFGKKSSKNRLSVGGSAPRPPRCYSRLLLLLCRVCSSAKCIFFRSKKNQVTTANVLPLLLLHFCTYFLIKTL